jgi:hypothetical protein
MFSSVDNADHAAHVDHSNGADDREGEYPPPAIPSQSQLRGIDVGWKYSRFSASPGASTTITCSTEGGFASKDSQASSNMIASSPFLKLILSSSYSANSGNPFWTI